MHLRLLLIGVGIITLLCAVALVVLLILELNLLFQ